MARRVNLDRTAKAIRMRASGMTLQAIGDHFGVTHATVWYWIANDERRNRKRDNMKRYSATVRKPKPYCSPDQLFDCGACGKVHAMDDCSAPRPKCRCGLSLPCNDCLPKDAAGCATERMYRESS